MAVTESDVRQVAALARLGLEESRIPALVRELNGILDHMQELEGVDIGSVPSDSSASLTPMRSDVPGLAIPLAAPREDFAPEMRDGFFIVPRLATHESEGEPSS
jgi:aspartyl-tRNA(Asn)/glutamyl-tRNA(Gln) amidotransferase subunit C